MIMPPSLTLTGKQASLVPLSMSHHDELVDAVKDGELWNLWFTFIPTPERMAAEIERRLTLQTQDEKVAIPPLVGALLKNEQDVTLFEKLVFMQSRNR